ncbi:hypothetical protein BGX26_011471, partial [Mortierella sp. AD094]
MFGRMQDLAGNDIANHPGDLFSNMFFHPGLEYSRNTLLIHPEARNNQPTFRHNRKRRFLQLDQEEQIEFGQLAQDLIDKVKNVKQDFNAFVEERLNSPEDNKIEIDESFSDYQADRPRFNRRYVLTGTMVTNGYELKLLAYSLTKPKPPSQPVPNTTQFKLKSILTELSDSTQVNAAFPQDR